MNPQKLILQSKDWKDFKKRVSKLDTKGKGDCFEVLTKAFLETDPRYTTKLRYVWHISNVPTKTRTKPNHCRNRKIYQRKKPLNSNSRNQQNH